MWGPGNLTQVLALTWQALYSLSCFPVPQNQSLKVLFILLIVLARGWTARSQEHTCSICGSAYKTAVFWAFVLCGEPVAD